MEELFPTIRQRLKVVKVVGHALEGAGLVQSQGVMTHQQVKSGGPVPFGLWFARRSGGHWDDTSDIRICWAGSPGQATKNEGRRFLRFFFSLQVFSKPYPAAKDLI